MLFRLALRFLVVRLTDYLDLCRVGSCCLFVVYLGLAQDLCKVGLCFVYLELFKVDLRLDYGFFGGSLGFTWGWLGLV